MVTIAAALFPLFYLALPVAAIVEIRQRGGPAPLFLLMLTVIVSDTAQYYTGRLFGRRPLAPLVSPKKTIEGALAGVAGVVEDHKKAFRARIIATALLVSLFGIGSAIAQSSCATKALSKDGKPLSGAARTSSIKKCCEDSALSKDGNPLSGAARTSFVKKCQADAG